MAELLRDTLEATAARLMPFSDTPELDAQTLLAHVSAVSRTWLLAHADSPWQSEQAEKLEALIQRLEAGEPLPYILGHWEFFGLDFDLTSDVLIPRPETELLVERAVAWLKSPVAAQRNGHSRSIADIGTGSGCIAISLAMNIPDVRLLATDISPAALKVARRNAQKFGVRHRIDFLACDVLPEPVHSHTTHRHFDLICANLPYIPTEKLHQLSVYKREPTLALDGGPDGLVPFRKLFERVPEWIAPGGRMLLEIEATRGPAVLSLAYDAFISASIHLHRDLAGHDRLLEIQLSTA